MAARAGAPVPPSPRCPGAATLAKWFGVSAADMPTAFPNLSRFNDPDLGFMGA